jgi:hydroxymethylglutaryl-CoA lyase
MKEVKVIECPRDAMQGIKQFIPTEVKADYLNTLLKVGFDTLDFGSFVSPRAIPQMRDTSAVLERLDLNGSHTKLLAIIANLRGAEEACAFDEISCLGFPFSVSEEFQKRNTNSTLEESLKRVEEIQKLALQKGKTLVIYLSMGFGNPYGEHWDEELVSSWAGRLAELGIRIMALSDTVGVSNPENISRLFSHLIPAFPAVEFGAHLHSHPSSWQEKVEAAAKSGCLRFDSAFRGIGGCPMADDALVGNLATENLVSYFNGEHAKTNLKTDFFNKALEKANEIFSGIL